MATFVLDGSVTMAWFFADEATEQTDQLMDRLNAGDRVVVAQHWFLEVANTLLMGERRKRCTPADASQFVDVLAGLSIDTDSETGTRAMAVTLNLGRTHGLTLYDAAYLELAMRLKLPLATLDSDLRKAAKKVGVDCWPEKN
jgi:predicted nucleic acid-binding protein